MRSFVGAGDRFFQDVQIVGGPRTRAVVETPTDATSLNDQFLSPKLIMRVRRNSLIQSGQVVTFDGLQYLVGDHAQSNEWRTHILLHCDRQVPWTRASTAVDPTTSLPKSQGAPQQLGTPWVYWERVLRAPVDQTTRMPNIDYIVATGENVQPTDLVAGRTIVRFDRALGILILGIKE